METHGEVLAPTASTLVTHGGCPTHGEVFTVCGQTHGKEMLTSTCLTHTQAFFCRARDGDTR
jgi:hypothetical protein